MVYILFTVLVEYFVLFHPITVKFVLFPFKLTKYSVIYRIKKA